MKSQIVLTAAAVTAVLFATPAQAAKAPGKARDYNGDGRRDIAIVLDGRVIVYFGGGKKQLVGARLSGFTTFTSADFDRDGHADLAVAHGPDVTIHYGSRKGLLSRRPVKLKTASGTDRPGLAVGDFDRNGRPDLVATVNQRYWLFRNVGKGKVAAKPVTVSWPETPGFYPHGPLEPSVGDFTGDGRPDLVFNSWTTNQFSGFDATILLAKGTRKGLGVARPLPYQGGLVSAVGDFNGDHRADLVTASKTATVPAVNRGVQVLYGRPDGLGRPQHLDLETPGAGKAGAFEVTTGDFNGDGRSELAAGNPANVWVLFGSREGLTTKGARRFTENFKGVEGKPTNWFGKMLAVSDVSGDGRPELLIESGVDRGSNGRIYILKNIRGRISTMGVRTLDAKNAPFYGDMI